MMKGEYYPKTMNWIRVKISFSLIRSALVCLRGSRSSRRKPYNIMDIDVDVQTAESGIKGSNTNFAGFIGPVFCCCCFLILRDETKVSPPPLPPLPWQFSRTFGA